MASIEEIAEKNDYNLNIPRYVDTFEEEEEIDLANIVKNLDKNFQIEKKLDEEISKFCKELNISAPIENSTNE